MGEGRGGGCSALELVRMYMEPCECVRLSSLV